MSKALFPAVFVGRVALLAHAGAGAIRLSGDTRYGAFGLLGVATAF